MKKFPAVLVCGIAVMVLTVILYFTILGSSVFGVIHFITLGAMLVAEAVTTGYAWSAKGSPRKVAAAVLSGIMIPYSVILSVVYIVNFPTGYGTYIGWYCAGTVIVNAIAFSLMRFDANKNEESALRRDTKDNMLGLRKLVKCIMADPAAAPHVDKLRQLEEKLHFSNDNVIAAEDANIRQLLLQLQENIADPEFDTKQMLSAIERAIDTRSITTSRTV